MMRTRQRLRVSCTEPDNEPPAVPVIMFTRCCPAVRRYVIQGRIRYLGR